MPRMIGDLRVEGDLMTDAAGFTDNPSVSTMLHPDGKSLVTMTEIANGTYKVDLARLSTEGRYQFTGNANGKLTTAHPAVYPDGRVINLAFDVSGDLA